MGTKQKSSPMLEKALAASESELRGTNVPLIDRLDKSVSEEIHAIAKELARTNGNQAAALRVIHEFGHVKVSKHILRDLILKYREGALK